MEDCQVENDHVTLVPPLTFFEVITKRITFKLHNLTRHITHPFVCMR